MFAAVSEEDRSQSFIIYGTSERSDQDNPTVEAELVSEKQTANLTVNLY